VEISHILTKLFENLILCDFLVKLNQNKHEWSLCDPIAKLLLPSISILDDYHG